MTERESPFVVVVGVDGSADARTAAEMALGEARVHAGRLLVVHAWSIPAYAAGAEILATLRVDELQRSAEELLAQEAAHLGSVEPGLDIDTVLRYGSPINVLLDVASKASLLVVGSRGMGRVAGLLLGSVSQAIVMRATCPVLVVPPTDGKHA